MTDGELVFVSDPDDPMKWHIFFDDVDGTGLSLCGNGHAGDWQPYPDAARLDTSLACADCLIGAGWLGQQLKQEQERRRP